MRIRPVTTADHDEVRRMVRALYERLGFRPLRNASLRFVFAR